MLRSDAAISRAKSRLPWSSGCASDFSGLACQGACTLRRTSWRSAVFRIRSRVSVSTSPTSQPVPGDFLSGNHSKASKPLSTAYSKGTMSAGAEDAVWFPMRMRVRSIILQTKRIRRASGLYRLSTGLYHIVPALGDDTLNILRGVKGACDCETDFGDREQQVRAEALVPHRALPRVI